MAWRLTSLLALTLLWPMSFCPPSALAQSSDIASSAKAEERASRKELKLSITRMTYESGDRRIVHLRRNKQISETEPKTQDATDGSSEKSGVKKTKIAETRKRGLKVIVQCNPIGEAEAIGIELKPRKRFKKRIDPIEVKAPKNHDLSDEKWRRIAELACLENEI